MGYKSFDFDDSRRGRAGGSRWNNQQHRRVKVTHVVQKKKRKENAPSDDGVHARFYSWPGVCGEPLGPHHRSIGNVVMGMTMFIHFFFSSFFVFCQRERGALPIYRESADKTVLYFYCVLLRPIVLLQSQLKIIPGPALYTEIYRRRVISCQQYSAFK